MRKDTAGPRRLRRGVDMPAGVEGDGVSQRVDGLCSLLSPDLEPDPWKSRRQSSRRLITLRAAGWVPPDLCPSGAGLALGTRVSCRLVTPSRVAPHRGCASSDRRGKPGALLVQWRSVCWTDGVTGTCLAIAPITPTRSRAIATTTWWAGFPRAIRRRKPLHSLTCAFQLISWRALGCGSSRSCICRLMLAG
jgi:hypothetical protein